MKVPLRTPLKIVLLLLLATIWSPLATRKHATAETARVREYTRKNGVVVAAHERARPSTTHPWGFRGMPISIPN
jgi:hypothetical protein